MADSNYDQNERLIEVLKNLEALTRGRGGASPRAPQNDEVERTTSKIKKLGGAVDSLAQNTVHADKDLKKFYGTTRDAATKMSEFAKSTAKMTTLLALSGGALNKMASMVSESVDTYREMIEVGQTFQGSLLDMNIAAAEARLPLDEFAKAVKKNSQVIAVMGVKAFGDLSKGVRTNLAQFGMLGMTTEQVTDMMGSYMQIQQSYGLMERMDRTKASESITKMALETTKVAELTGKSRKELMESSTKALTQDSIRSAMLMMSGRDTQKFQDALIKTTTYLAGMPGQAGDTLTNMLAQTVGRGSAMLSDDMQSFVNAGMFGITDMMDKMAAKVKSGNVSDAELDEFRKKFVEEGMRNMSNLKLQADTGNQDAKKAIAMIAEVKNLDAKRLEETKKMTPATKFLLNLQDNVKQLSGFIKEKFLKGFEAVWNGFEKAGSSGIFENLTNKIAPAIEYMGAKVGEWLKPENMAAFGNGLGMVAKILGQVADVGFSLFGMLGNLYSKLETVFGGFTTAVMVATAVMVKMGASYIKNKMGEQFQIGGMNRFAQGNALRVMVMNGGGGGGFGDDFGGSSRRRGGGRARPGGGVRGRVGRAGRTMGRGLGKGASNILKNGKGFGVGAAAMALGGMALDAAPDFAGKGVLSGGLGVAGAASTGAMIGSAIPGIGTLIGGAVGGLIGMYQNWEEISTGLSEMWSKGTEFASSAYESFMGSVSDIWSNVSGLDWGGMLDSAVSGFQNAQAFVRGVFDKIGSWFGNIFSWVGSLVPSEGMLANMIGSTPIGAAVMGAMNAISGANISGPSSTGTNSAASVNTDMLAKQVNDLQNAQAQIMKENSELRSKLADMVDILKENNMIHKAGYGGMIDETKKGNRDLGAMSGRSI